MAFKLRILPGLLVVIMAFCNQEVFGVNSTVTPTAVPSSSTSVSGNGSTVAVPVVTQISPTATQTVSPTSSMAPSTKFVTLVMVSLEVETCNEESKKDLNDSIGALYNDPGYDFKSAEFIMANNNEKCVFNITMKFGEERLKTDIIAKFENATNIDKSIKGKILHINAKVTGVELGDFKATDEECKEKCCGTGGPIEVKQECKPKDKCENYKLTKIESDCNNVCEKVCVGAMFKMSLLVLVVIGLINWFLKE